MHHIAIATDQLALMIEFYTTIPGLREIRRNHREDKSLRSVWFEYEGSDIILMLEEENFAKAPYALVFSLDSSGFTKEGMKAELRDKKIPLDGETEFTIYFRDPDNNRLGFSDL